MSVVVEQQQMCEETLRATLEDSKREKSLSSKRSKSHVS